VLEFYNKTPRSVIELAEENDLMRFIENDIKVKMINSPYKTISVDTPKDLTEVIKILKGNIN
jgi:3-deoxy-manno-octulosonate cytidylyltransferase (CMP-KDO synthetase)